MCNRNRKTFVQIRKELRETVPVPSTTPIVRSLEPSKRGERRRTKRAPVAAKSRLTSRDLQARAIDHPKQLAAVSVPGPRQEPSIYDGMSPREIAMSERPDRTSEPFLKGWRHRIYR
jgi:hypothetical protein